MNIKKNTIDKYLLKYAEKGVHEIDVVMDVYDYVIVIPICNELSDCLDTIFSEIDKSLSVLVVLVVNSPSTNINPKYQINNIKYINKLTNKSNLNYHLSNHCRLLKFSDKFDTVLVDRNSDGLQIDENLGVGLARKIGCDIALKCYQSGRIKTPWIFSTDADVILPKNYFKQIHQFKSEYSAIVMDFEHVSNDALLNKLQFYYDFKIRYYHAGIIFAGSTYDYIPLGSTLIAGMKCYAQVRGFPKKNAGEDFYLLNKLAKIKPIAYKKNTTRIKIKSRFSNRVPFGTGPALIKINALDSINEYLYYHPRCFELLKLWIEYLKLMWSENKLNIKSPDLPELSEIYVFFNCQSVFEKSQSQITSENRWLQFVQQWFDSFKTLKAVHFFDKHLCKQNLQQLLNSSGFAKVSNPVLDRFLKNS